MTFIRRLKILVLEIIPIIFFVTPSLAQAQLDEFCVNDYSNCLRLVEQKLAEQPKSKIEFYKLKMYQLDSLYYLGKYQQLDIEMGKLINASRLPKVVELKIHIYSAKLKIGQKDDPERKAHLAKAQLIFQALLKTGDDPNTLIDYANLHIYLGQYTEGIRLLKQLERKFSDHKNANIIAKVAINLGNLYLLTGDLVKAQTQYLVAMEHSRKAGLINVNIIANYNYGRTFQKLEQNSKAIAIFLELIPRASELVDSNIDELTYYRLGQLYVAEKNWTLAKLYLEKVDINDKFDSYEERVDALMAIINKNLKGS
ncbi:tetratricopeptide repeat protein [Psychrosphaera sp. B3R10]|uniref:tetratricopeptide repeat protein n=1 Tax=unclassified Psychrosphaera TaxID=2641570 RepID=UPI001C09AD50|nr:MULTISPECIES: tetratricopeptide repeat protein [unclassified Psychrosphaera]MBU2883094.1 tetratricopeptide repeat protein [Psychrosphaera sp. I2R16]MBU2988551.1 tetratricopeptide repeat protein [Psychrosphaera sp. B3R10]MDO6719612.1 tetratricopeptide repeat protein [Psychrosphaera sp. 1_MG-2023]